MVVGALIGAVLVSKSLGGIEASVGGAIGGAIAFGLMGYVAGLVIGSLAHLAGKE
jgi:hypothetical protein